jgi:RNA polymerase sigma-70 factor (ECF subfamily)
VSSVVVQERADAQFSALFAAHYPDLLRYAVRRVGPDAAPDVVADVFLVAWRRRAELPADAPRVWLYGVAANVVANQLRSERRRSRLRSRLADEPPATPAPVNERVLAALGRLRPAEQEVLRLTEWEQLSADEAAVVLGCSPGAFRVRLHRARRKFAAELETED